MEPRTRQLQLLGPTRVVVDGRVAPLRHRETDVLAALSLERGRPISASVIADALWTVPPPSARKTIQNHIARVRAVLGADAVETRQSLYCLGPGWQVDVDTFVQLCDEADRDRRVGDFEGQRARLASALALVNGRPFASIEVTSAVFAAQRRTAERIDQATVAHIGALIDTGRHQEAIRATDDYVQLHPDREVVWMFRSIALLRNGDRRSAIDALQQCRRHVREATGLPVGYAVQRLESLALADDQAALRLPVAVLTDSAQSVPGVATASEQFFVGRSEELSTLDGLLSAARRESSPAVVVVRGAPGSGRSAFGRRAAILAAADGWITARAICRPVSIRPLEPFGELLAQLLRQRPGVSTNDFFGSTLMDRLDVVAAVQEPAVKRRGAASLADDTVQIFLSLCAESPVVIVVDDAELLPPSSLQILEALRKSAAQLVVILLGADREIALTPTATIRLGALTSHEMHRLYATLTGSSADDATIVALHVSTGGLPGPLRESILEAREMAERTSDPPEDLSAAEFSNDSSPRPRAGGELASDHAVRNSLGRAAPNVVDLCRALALATTPPDRHLLAALAAKIGFENSSVVVADAVARGLVAIDESGVATLTSDSVAHHALAQCSHERWTQLHEAWWETLSAAGAATFSVVEHAVATAAIRPQRALGALDSAKAAATANGMFLEAAEFEGRAIEILKPGKTDRAEEFRRRIDRCELLRQGGDTSYPAELWRLVDDAEGVGDRIVLAQAAGLLCSLGPSTRFGIPDHEIGDLVERTLWNCPDSVVRSRAHAQASLFYSSTDFARSEAHFVRALDDARAANDEEALAYALGFAGVAFLNPDHVAQRHEFALELVRLGEKLGSELHRIEALHLLYGTQIQLGDPTVWMTERALRTIDMAALGKPQRWMANYMQVGLDHLRGRLELAESHNDRVLSSQPVDPSRAMANYAVQLFGIRVAQGRAGELTEMVHSVVKDQPLARAWFGFYGFASACVGDFEAVRAACSATEDGRNLPRDIGWMGGVWLLARAAARAGFVDSASVLLPQLQPYSGQMTWVGICSYGPVDLALAELAHCLGDHDEARTHVERASAVVRRMNAPAFDEDISTTRMRLAL